MSGKERCPHCGQDYDPGLVFCPGCGRRVRQAHGAYVPATPGTGARMGDPNRAALRVAIAVAVALGAAFLIFVMPRLKPKRVKPPAVHIPAPQPAPGHTDSAQPPEIVPFTEEELAEFQAAVETAVFEFLDNDVRGNFEDMYRAMTPKLQSRLQNLYPDNGITDDETYARMRNDPAAEPRVRKIVTTGIVKPTGPRAVIEADVEALHDQREIPLRYRFVMVDLGDEVWRVDGYAAGPEGPDVFTRRADFNHDGADETIEFVRDLVTHRGRWEVIAADGAQQYAFEMKTCPAQKQGAGKQPAPDDEPEEDEKKLNPIRIHPMRKAEQELFRGQFTMWADSIEFDDAVERKRTGFEMDSGCPEGNKYYVIFFNGAYQEIVYTDEQE